MALTVGSLFSGIGGFDIAARAMGWDTRWFVEWDPTCQFWLAEHFPHRPIYGDITSINFHAVEPSGMIRPKDSGSIAFGGSRCRTARPRECGKIARVSSSPASRTVKKLHIARVVFDAYGSPIFPTTRGRYG